MFVIRCRTQLPQLSNHLYKTIINRTTFHPQPIKMSSTSAPVDANNNNDDNSNNNKTGKRRRTTDENGASPSSSSEHPHQFQASSRTDRPEDQWKFRAPYKIHESTENFPTKWKGSCHCGAIQYQLSRPKPLSAKYCHCTTCQRLHGAPFQWAAIFHKEDINFTKGHHDLAWYDPTSKKQDHHLPCKVQCGYCRAPIMDEGRNMILLFPPLIKGINTKEGREAFKPECHMFYPERVVDVKDGLPKWAGLNGDSEMCDEETGEVIEGSKPEKKKKEEEDDGKKDENGKKGGEEGKKE